MSYPARMVGGQLQVKSGERWRRGIAKNCLVCDMIFYRPLDLRSGEGFYCTRMCQAKANIIVLADRRLPKFCVICGNLFRVTKSKYDRHKTCGQPNCKRELASRVTKARHG